MDINLCIEILSKRNTVQCECNSLDHIGCSRLPNSQIKFNQKTSLSGSATITDDDSESKQQKANHVATMSNYDLLKFMMSLQRTRVVEYSSFEQAFQLLISNNKLEEYPLLVGEMTSRFSVLSLNVIKVKVRPLIILI
jgi:hypothetical protein